MPNRLASATSPYLRQHAENPVDWYPFGVEAFAEARRRDQPILLSVGYSACHWCHVMAHESFEDSDIARLMNERFVSIKVDREELPDVDQIYQRALQLQGESGGWPLTMFLTPDGVPFFGGTYFPPGDRYGRPGFRRVLLGLSEAWTKDRDRLVAHSASYKEGLQKVAAHELGDGALVPSDRALDDAILALLARTDRVHGGFGGAPKFPNPSALRLLLRGARRRELRGGDAKELDDAVAAALVHMAEGGIYDQVGGGFARYSTDATWLVPHFEKMLYDNAQLLSLYAEAWQRHRDPRYARVIRGTASFLERELRAPEGGLYTALDADSDGVEGRFYVWTWAELSAVLDADELELARRLLGADAEGNWRDPHGHAPTGANVLSIVAAAKDEAEQRRLDAVLHKLFLARASRTRPGTDDKVLASTNGMAIAGLATAGRVLGDPTLVEAARRTAAFVLERLRDARTGRLLRTWSRGEARLPGTLDDHAFVADGLFALYEATAETRWFEAGHELLELAIRLFWDPDERIFYVTAAEEPELPRLIERPISSYDGAVPAGASVLVDRLLVVGEALGDRRLVEIAEQAILRRAARAFEQPFAYAHLLGAFDTLLEGAAQIVLTGDAAARAGLAAGVAEVFIPNALVTYAEAAPQGLRALVGDKRAATASAFVCRAHRCEAPVSDRASLLARLSVMSGSGR